MTVDLATLPCPHYALPIPDDATTNARWSPLMIEIADHIGAPATLQFIIRFGGQHVRIPLDPKRAFFRDSLGEEATKTICHVFGGETLFLPTGRAAILYARRAGILSRVRAGSISAADAARILRSSRRYLTSLLNETDEGMDNA